MMKEKKLSWEELEAKAIYTPEKEENEEEKENNKKTKISLKLNKTKNKLQKELQNEKNTETKPQNKKKSKPQNKNEKPQKTSILTKKINIEPTTLIAITTLILIAVMIFSILFAILNINNTNIINGIKIEGIDVSGLTREEAKTKIETIYNEKKEKDITLKYKDFETTLSQDIIETNYDIEKAINQAITTGKNGNIITNNYNILFALIGKKNIKIDMTINEEQTQKAIEDIQTNLPGTIEEPDYYIEDNKLIITPGKTGLKISTNNLINKIKNNLNNITNNQEYIEIPVEKAWPNKIDIEKIHSEIYKEVQDAYITKDPVAVHPEVEGIDFNIEEAKKILEENKEKYEIPLQITKPNTTISQLGSEAFPNKLGTHTTRYDGGDENRSTNLEIACEKINEKVILPGETFSYNKTLGARTTAAGYKTAKVYENGAVVDGIGGGICQISSTLYNAVLKANLEIIERRNHQFITSYVPEGRDATVAYGVTDFKFKNNRKYAIKIKATASNGVATIDIYGIKEEIEYQITFDTKTISTIPCTTKYIDDNMLPAGTEEIKQKGANGIITETYIIKSLNGQVVSKTLLSKDTYSAMTRTILRGTKK